MKRVGLRAFAGLVFLLAVLATVLFVSAGTPGYWQGWVFLGVFGAATSAISIDLARRDPELLARRVRAGPLAEPTAAQKLVQSVASLAFLSVFVLGGLDQRAGWSRVPGVLSLGGEGLVALGLYVVFRVFRANSFASATIEVTESQPVITSGPYAVVRHPMYSGALLMLLGVPLAIGSYWAFSGVALLAAVIVWRSSDEEKYLMARLRGYDVYRERVPRRLIPGIW